MQNIPFYNPEGLIGRKTEKAINFILQLKKKKSHEQSELITKPNLKSNFLT